MIIKAINSIPHKLPVPYNLTESLINLAASASPSDNMTLAFFSSSSFITMNFYLSASCWAIYFYSIADAYSFINPKWVIETSSSIILKSLALSVKVSWGEEADKYLIITFIS